MGEDLTATVPALRGVLLPDPRIGFTEFSTSLSTVTQAGPLPGVPVAQDDTEMTLEATGSQAASGAMRIRTIASGHPGTDGARFCWRNDGDTLWRGWDPPTAISAFEFIDRSVTTGYWKWPHAVTLPSGKIVAVAEQASQSIHCYTRSAAGVWGAEVDIYDRGSAYTNRASPCLVLLPSGRLLCFFWREKGTAASVWMYYSDDDGATWTVGSRAALKASISTSTYAQNRLRAAYLDGQIILVAHLTATTSEEVHQWASGDLGSTFTAVDSMVTASQDYGYPDVIEYGGALVVAYIKSDGTDIFPYVRRLGSAFAPLTGATEVLATDSGNAMQWGTVAGGVFTAGNLALWADEDGSLYVAGLDHDAAGGALKEMMLARSIDGGESWGTLGTSTAGNGTGAAVWYGHDANSYPTDFCAVSALGATVLLHRFEANPGTADDSLCQTTLGGFTTVEMPEQDALNLALANRSGWEFTWLPFDEPDNLGSSPYTWGKATSGSPTTGLGTSGLHISHGGTSGAVVYDVVPQTANAEAVLLVEVKPTNAGPDGIVRIRTTNGTNLDIDVQVTITALGALTFADNHGSTLGSASGVDVTTSGIQVLLAASDPTTAKASAWYRALGTDREWVALATNQSCTTSTLSTATAAWGSVAGTTGSIYFRLAAATWGSYAGVGLSGGQSNPDDLLGRAYMPAGVWVDSGLKIQAIDGPTFRNDVWNIDTRYEHAVDHLHPDVSASPRRGWRATGTDATELVWELSSTVSDVAPMPDALFGVHLSRINWQTGSFWGRESGGTWTKILDIDSSSGQTGLKFVRDGSMVGCDPTGGNDAGRWWPLDALHGGTWDNGTELRPIATNTPGGWVTTATATNSRNTQLTLSAYDAGDVSSGSSGAIWSRDVTVISPPTAGVTYSAYKLVIDSQSTVNGDLRVGAVLFGPVLVWGGEYSWGRGLGLEVNQATTTTPGGARSVRRLGPTRRVVEVGWPDALDASEIQGDHTGADYYRAYTSGPIVGGEGDALWSARGMIERLSREGSLCVYFDGFPVESSATDLTINHREQHLYGRVTTTTHRFDNVQGDEWTNEVHRGGRLRFEEEL